MGRHGVLKSSCVIATWLLGDDAPGACHETVTVTVNESAVPAVTTVGTLAPVAPGSSGARAGV
jgi:hypothetical protein